MKLNISQKSWVLYDVANSAYQLVIVTAIFPIYYASVVPEQVDLLGYLIPSESFYLLMFSAAYLFVCLINPLLSGIADHTSSKKSFMIGFTSLGIIGTIGLCFFDENNLAFGYFAAFISTVGYTGSIVFYNAFLPIVGKRNEQDFISAKGYAWGYTSSMILLTIALVPFIFELFPANIASKFTFLLVAIWWLVFAIISISGLPNEEKKSLVNNLFWSGYIQLIKALKSIFSHKIVCLFLASFFFYMMGVQTVFYAATLFGKQELKLDSNLLILTMLLIQALGALGANLLAKLAYKKNNFFALVVTLVLWTLVTIFAYFINSPIEFILASVVVGFVMGGIQSLSRSTFSKWTYDLKNKASLFSLLDFTEKIGIVIGTLSFAYFTSLFNSMRIAILVLVFFFLVGLILLLCTRLYKSAK